MMKEKTIGELAQEYPDKSYIELERYRDADRLEEAQRIPVTESRQKQEELEPIEGEEERLREEVGACITAGMKRDREATEKMKNKKEFKKEIDYHRYWKDMYEKEHKLRQEADESLANALEVNESHQKLNGKLQERLTELEEENKKLHTHLNLKIESARKAGF
jgi:uncharacterized protein (DUF608 family)